MNMEQALVARVLAGDGEAKAAFAMMFRPRLIRASAYFVGADGTEAEDIVQETFLAAWPQLKDLAFSEPVYAWLRQICLKKCYLQLRARQQLVQDLEEQVELLLKNRALQRLRDSDLEAYRRGKIALRHELILRLNADSRQVIEVRTQKIKFAKSSHALGLPLGPFLSRLARALDEMRLLLEQMPEDRSHQKAEI